MILQNSLSLNGNSPITVQAGSTYVDAGATATDNVDGDITSRIVTVNPVDTNIVADYTVTYNVEDNAGNAAVEVTRTVTVEDTTPPELTVPANITYEMNDPEAVTLYQHIEYNTRQGETDGYAVSLGIGQYTKDDLIAKEYY